MAPAFLAHYRPDLVLVMSPIYLPEITATLARLHLPPHRLLSVETPEHLEAA